MGLISLGETVGSSTGVAVTSSASADTFGNWATLKSSTAARVDAVHLTIIPTTGAGRNFILELGTGAALSETTLVAIPVFVPSVNKAMRIMLPLTIPSGTRVAARCKDGTGSGVLRVTAMGQEQTSLMTQGATSGTLLNTITGSNGFTALDTGGTIHTFVSATISASTSADYNAFVVIFRDTTSGGTANSLLKLKDDGTEFAAHFYKRLTNNDGNISTVGPFFHSVASGSSVTVEGESDSTTINDLTVAVIGFNLTAPSGGTTLITGNDMVNTETFARGAASKIVTVKILDTAGAPKTGLAYNTGSFTCYKQVGASATPTPVTLANMTLGTYTSNGFKEIDATNLPGMYQYCPATLDASADYEVHNFRLSGTILDTPFTIKLTAGDPRAATVDANLTQVSGDSTAADNLEAMLDGTGGVTLSAVLGSNAITASSIASDAITAGKIAADAIGASELATDAVTEIANAVVEAEITALKTYNRSADETATITGPTSGSNSLGVTTDASYNPIKTF